MTKVAEEVDLSTNLLTRLIAGSLPYFSKAQLTAEKAACCRFITQIMKNYGDKEVSGMWLSISVSNFLKWKIVFMTYMY